ncbi:MAG TPA: DUF485 domain-containing protein [Verrucomicrobiales bacterium]|nr:DUF485 domain-containing protein [Verrucomicrobiales bacterium]HRJ08477.1 DUF485 domain-containing protein [Prosthecobacter sp.]HRK15829.1 DUF485 domain-containing protein [Prosthecobacter sp.]
MTENQMKVDWAALEAKPEFRALLARKARFITAASVFFVVYYFSLLVLVGWFPDLMKKEVLGRINLAYLFALSQFFMAWGLAWLYTRKAAQWDLEAANIVRGH